MHLTIGWLYAATMNIYGDRGNVIALKRRAEWRGISTTVHEINIGDAIPADIDCFFWGGGQDQEQVAVAHDLQGPKGQALAAAVEEGASLLAVCGGYQLLGHEYRPHAAEVLPGVGIIDAVSVAGPERFIGNVVIDSEWGTLVGFENHSGLTTLGPDLQPMGKVRVGRGNNGKDGTEGARHRNALGCYLHGSLLPKNPALTDWLIARGLERRNGAVELPPIDDGFELKAHATAVERALVTR
jgi:CobQ-like glutamine amidotransferase family enzyme